jgi:hypothetical protein
MHAIDEQVQRWWLDAEAPVRRDVPHQLQRAAPKLARSQYLWRDRRNRQVGRQHGHLQQHAARALQ